MNHIPRVPLSRWRLQNHMVVQGVQGQTQGQVQSMSLGYSTSEVPHCPGRTVGPILSSEEKSELAESFKGPRPRPRPR